MIRPSGGASHTLRTRFASLAEITIIKIIINYQLSIINWSAKRDYVNYQLKKQ